MTKKILIGVAWPYPNGDLHVGHLAGVYLPADIFARYNRLVGNEVLMVSGTDSHGTPVTVLADKEGVTPKEIFERYHQRFIDVQKAIGITYDLYTHTDTENHHKISQQMFLQLLKNGYLFKSKQKQLYSETQHRFLPDRFVEGTCPVCGYASARGDQCENCGSLLDAVQLINPKAKADGATPVVKETEHYFLDLPALKSQIQEYLTDKDYWRSAVLSFSRNYANNVESRAITRDMDWGIPVPIAGEDGKCLYVWFEAVIGYLSATIEWSNLNGHPQLWKTFWYDQDALIYNFLGKDNVPFHTVIWPAELLGAKNLDNSDNTFNLPFGVPANQFLNLGGQKFSKSSGISLFVSDLVNAYGPDAVRYYLSATMPETKDTEWSWNDFAQRNNSELLAKWGNLVQRVLSQIWRNFDGLIPVPGELNKEDLQLTRQSVEAFEGIGTLLSACRFREALSSAMELASATNRYLDSQAPWKVIKEDKNRAGTQLYVAASVIDSLTILLSPFIPHMCEAVRQQLGHVDPLFGDQYVSSVTDVRGQHDILRYSHPSSHMLWQSSTLQPNSRLPNEPKPLVQKLETPNQ